MNFNKLQKMTKLDDYSAHLRSIKYKGIPYMEGYFGKMKILRPIQIDTGSTRSSISLATFKNLPHDCIIETKRGTNNKKFTDIQNNRVHMWGQQK